MVTHFRIGTNRPTERLNLHVSSVSPLPKSYRVAFSDPNWQNAMRDEYNALIKNKTWVLVPRPTDMNIVRCIWLFRHKHLADGTLSRYKARLVANGSTQLEGRSLYGLKQAPRAWFQWFSSYITRVGFHSSRCDSSLFIYKHGPDTTNLLLYVDDIVLTASSQPLLQRIIASLHQEFFMIDLGSLNYFLGISITRDSSGLFLSQKKYAIEILEKAHMVSCIPSRTPIDTESKLGVDGDPVSDPTLYRSLAGSLQYLTFTRPDISYAVQQIWLLNTDVELELGCPTTQRSTSGYCVFLGNNLLSWSAKRQPTLSRSSVEAEYRGVANPIAETCRLRNLLLQHQRTKHIEIDIHFVRDLVAAGQQDLEQIHEDDLKAMDLKCHLSLLSMRVKGYYQRTGKKIFINANDTAGYDKSKFKNQDNTRKQGNNKDTSSKAMLAIDGVGFDWSDMAEEQVQKNMALMAFSDSEVYNDKTCSKTCLKNYETIKKQCDDLIVKLNQTEFTTTTYKRGLATVEEQLITYRKNEVLFSKEVAVLKREVACKDYEINVLKSEFEKVKQENEGIEFKIKKFDKASKDLDKLLGSQITDKSKRGLGYNDVPLPHPLIYNRPKKLDMSYSSLDEFKEPEFKAYGSEDKQVSKESSSFVESSFNVDKETVFLVDKKGESKKLEWTEVQSTRKVNYNYTTKRTHPNAQRNMVPRAVLMKTGIKPFNTARTVNTAHPKSIIFSAKPMPRFSKTAQSTVKRPFQPKTVLTNKRFTQKVNIAKAQVVNTARPKAVKTARPNSTVVNVVKGKPQHDDTGFVDNGCSRHMTGNIAYLSDFKEFDGGYVTFRGGAHGGRISGKGTLKTDSLDFEDVYFINNFDMKNIVPKESLTCLVAKAT
ncbi:ribonuclease H-like domain-containing protein, partial [Tanacetum coccineum]